MSKPSSHAARMSGSPGGQVASAGPAVTVPPSARSRPVSSARFHRRFSAGTSAAVRGFSGGAITAAATGMSGLRSTCRGVSGRGPDSAIHLLSATAWVTTGESSASLAASESAASSTERPYRRAARRSASSASRIRPDIGAISASPVPTNSPRPDRRGKRAVIVRTSSIVPMRTGADIRPRPPAGPCYRVSTDVAVRFRDAANSSLDCQLNVRYPDVIFRDSEPYDVTIVAATSSSSSRSRRNPRSRPTPPQSTLSTPPQAYPATSSSSSTRTGARSARSKSTVSTGRDAGTWFARCATAR